jgi:hypothetical protein
MPTFDSIKDQPRSYTTVAVMTLAHAGDFNDLAFGARHFGEEKSGVAVGHPASFSVGGSNPNSSAFAIVMNQKAPLGFEIGNAAVGNPCAGDRVRDNQVFGLQNQFGSEPKRHSDGRYKRGNQNVNDEVVALGWIKQGLRQKQAVEQNSHSAPYQVASGPVGHISIHASIFSGESLDRKNQTK